MTLLDQLQSATEGSREISDDVLKACGWKYDPGKDAREAGWVDPAGTFYDYWDDPHARSRNPIPHRPDPSRNLQDAVSLAPEGMRGSVDFGGKAPFIVMLADDYEATYRGATPALAACQAIIKATHTGP